MGHLSKTASILLPMALLGACTTASADRSTLPRTATGQSTTGQPTARVPATRPPPPPPIELQDPNVMQLPGLEGVIGETPAQLRQRFGTPRLDVREGDARKIQFSGTACVLDVYLYPLGRNNRVLATHLEARRASDGAEVDRIACVNALQN